jgi:hypothetical protein
MTTGRQKYAPTDLFAFAALCLLLYAGDHSPRAAPCTNHILKLKSKFLTKRSEIRKGKYKQKRDPKNPTDWENYFKIS